MGDKVRSQQMEHARHGDEDGDAFAVDEVDGALGFELIDEVGFGGEEWGDPEAHELAEDVAEGEGVEETQRVNEALVAAVLCDLVFDGLEAGQDVAVSVDDALWGGGCAGGEDDLKGSLSVDDGANFEVWFEGELID